MKTNQGYSRSPLGYMGTKYEQLRYIEPLLDKSKKNFIDLFAGSGVVYINMLKHYSHVFANDVLEPIIELHKAIINNPEEFKRIVRNISSSELQNKDQFKVLMDAYKYHPTLERLFCLIQLSIRYSLELDKEGQFNMRFSQRRVYNNFEEKLDEFVNCLKNNNKEIIYSTESFEKFTVPDNSMVYLDPPYSGTGAGYNRLWCDEMDIKLYEFIKTIDKRGNSFLLCGTLVHGGVQNNLLRKLVIKDNFHIKHLPHHKKKHSKNTIEVMVTNYLLS